MRLDQINLGWDVMRWDCIGYVEIRWDYKKCEMKLHEMRRWDVINLNEIR